MSYNRLLKRKKTGINSAISRPKLSSRSNTTSPTLLSDGSSTLQKRAKINDSIYNPDTLLAKKEMNDLKTKNAQMGDIILEIEQSQQRLENNEPRLKQTLQKVRDLQATVQTIEQRHTAELQRIKDKFYMKNRELILQNELQKEELSKHQFKLDNFERMSMDAAKSLENVKNENKQLLATKDQVEASFKKIDGNLDNMRQQKKEKQAALKAAQERLKRISESKADKKQYIKDMQEKLLTNEQLRRKKHERLLLLKGNIRVFCRVRPPLKDSNIFNVRYFGDDNESLELAEETTSALGRVSQKKYIYTFDRVFSASSTQQECFEEISQLVQSALDGFNVCIFAYGQTGSGKTYTMQGPSSSPNEDTVGIIPRAVHQIYDVTEQLKQFGWEYSMEGQFLEIYNENIHDLLGDTSTFGKIKHEIHHDKNGRTTVNDMTTVVLDSPTKVEKMLKKANQNRSTGATNMNERSSRSHSVFTLRLSGYNKLTDERSVGILNLIDLAGSERVSMSGATGDRLTETISINKSLSCLKSVIHALANKKEGGHIPYRDSKLTYLLQNSLGGNCKTLMFVNVSPLAEHFNESICSLRFATEVNSCHVGTAKKLAVK